MEPVPWGPAERTRHQKSLVALQNPLSLPKQMGLWEGGQCQAAPGSSGSSRVLELPHSLSRKDGKGCALPQGWIWEKRLGRRSSSQRSSQPSGIPQGGFGILPRRPAGVLPQGQGTAATGAEPPPQLLRCSSCLPG